MAPRIWTDADILDVLQRHADGQSATVIAGTLGASRAAVLGVLHRVRQAQEAMLPLCDASVLAVLRQAAAGVPFADIARDTGRSRLALIGLFHTCTGSAT